MSLVEVDRPTQTPNSCGPAAPAILNALSDPVLVVDDKGQIGFVNLACEQFFAAGSALLLGKDLTDLLPVDSPVVALIEQARERCQSFSDHSITLETPRIGPVVVSVDAAPLNELTGDVVVALRPYSIARKIDQQLIHRHAARAVTSMAAMLAHEVKNPLAGIRGAAQLLEASLEDEDRMLTELICKESERIAALVDRLEMFSDSRPLRRKAVNVHEVLDYVRRVAESSFAHRIRFIVHYDPSLPAVYGNRDLLIQAVMNLVKNAAEAVSPDGGEIRLSTGYRKGVRMAARGGDSLVDLPLEVCIQDNGPGVPDDLKSHLFDPFVTTKPGGRGLGLALVAKIIGDHGGVIEVESAPRRTLFRMMLPIIDEAGGEA